MAAIGFIGLGNLGRAMAERLIEQGLELVVWNRTPRRAEGLNATVAESPSDVISKTDHVFLNLFDSDAVRQVIGDRDGLIHGAARGKTIIDTTTNHFDAVPDFYDDLAEAGARYLEAPVLGSVVPASQGKLTILVSGKREVFDAAKPLLELLGENIFFLGTPTLASQMKIINNLALGAFMTTLAESLTYGEACGIDRRMVLDILAAGAGNSAVLNAKKTKLLEDNYAPHFSVDAIYKDLDYLQDLARELKRPLFLGSAAREIFAIARARGMEDQDFSAVAEVLRNL